MPDPEGPDPATFEAMREALHLPADLTRFVLEGPALNICAEVANRLIAAKVADAVKAERERLRGLLPEVLRREGEELKRSLEFSFAADAVLAALAESEPDPGPEPTSTLDPDKEAARMAAEIEQREADRRERAEQQEGPNQ